MNPKSTKKDKSYAFESKKQPRGIHLFDTHYVIHAEDVPRALTLKYYAPSKQDFEILLDAARINYYFGEAL